MARFLRELRLNDNDSVSYVYSYVRECQVSSLHGMVHFFQRCTLKKSVRKVFGFNVSDFHYNFPSHTNENLNFVSSSNVLNLNIIFKKNVSLCFEVEICAAAA